MKRKVNTASTGLRLRVNAEQKAALDRFAKKRGTNASNLLRDHIETLTGVPDPMRRIARREGR